MDLFINVALVFFRKKTNGTKLYLERTSLKNCVFTLNSVFFVFSIFRNVNLFKFIFKLHIRNLHQKLHKKVYLTIL